MTTLHAKLKELREVCEKATSGEWRAYDWTQFPRVDEYKEGCVRIESETTVVAFCFDGKPNHDALFIAQARTMLPRLIEALEKAIEQRDHYVEVASDHEPFKKDIIELNKQITEILEKP